MRHLIILIDSVSDIDGCPLYGTASSIKPVYFAENMTTACSAAGVAFQFEQGGCWGGRWRSIIRHAASDSSVKLLLERIMVMTCNAIVQVNSVLYYHSSEAIFSGDLYPVTPRPMIKRAGATGYAKDIVMLDREEVASIICNFANEYWSKRDWENATRLK